MLIQPRLEGAGGFAGGVFSTGPIQIHGIAATIKLREYGPGEKRFRGLESSGA